MRYIYASVDFQFQMHSLMFRKQRNDHDITRTSWHTTCHRGTSVRGNAQNLRNRNHLNLAMGNAKSENQHNKWEDNRTEKA